MRGQSVKPIGSVAEDEVVLEEPEEAKDEEHGKRKIQKMQDPIRPSQAEVEEHNLTHLPYRSWCKHCVRGRKKELPHRVEKAAEERTMPEFHFDFAYFLARKKPETISRY